MKKIVTLLLEHWLLIASIISFYWGLRAARLYYLERLENGQYELSIKEYHLWWSFYHFTFAFVGSMAGWFCFNFLLMRINNEVYSTICPAVHQLRGFDISDLFLFVFALLGLTGHLPQAFYGFVKSFSKLAESVVNKISG